MRKNDIIKLLNLQEGKVKKIKYIENNIFVYLSFSPKDHVCPKCGCHTKTIHDYRKRKVKHIMINNKQVYLCFSHRRYACKECGARFSEKHKFIEKNYNISNTVIHNVWKDLTRQINFKEVAKNNGISSMSVIRYMQFLGIFNQVNELPEYIGIDEFRGNAGGNKFQVVITDLKTHKVIDVIAARTENDIYNYLNKITNKEKVKLVTIDLSVFFKRIVKDNFRNAKIVADPFHYTRLICWGLDNVRKKIQKTVTKEKRIYFKRSKYILHKRERQLTIDQLKQLNVMLEYNEELRWAYSIEEGLYEIRDEKDLKEKKKMFKEWLYYAENCNLPEFNGHIETFRRWYKYILNSFETNYTNGITEGLNTKIKTIKRMSYGFRNFNNFRLKILLTCS